MKNIDIMIISLSLDRERQEKIQILFKQNKLHYSIVDAVDGRHIMAKDYFPLAKNPNFFFNRRRIISPSEVGCRLSHEKALTQFVCNSTNEWLIIFEDDIIFKNDLIEFLKIINDMNFNDDIVIHLGGQDGLSTVNRLFFTKCALFEKYKIKKVFPLTLRWLYRTCGYIVNRQAAKKLLNAHQNNTFVADDWAFILKKANINKILYRNFIIHPVDLTNSSIEKERK